MMHSLLSQTVAGHSSISLAILVVRGCSLVDQCKAQQCASARPHTPRRAPRAQPRPDRGYGRAFPG